MFFLFCLFLNVYRWVYSGKLILFFFIGVINVFVYVGFGIFFIIFVSFICIVIIFNIFLIDRGDDFFLIKKYFLRIGMFVLICVYVCLMILFFVVIIR